MSHDYVSQDQLNALMLPRRFQNLESSGVGIMPMGEEEVKVAKSEAPVTTGAWCNRE